MISLISALKSIVAGDRNSTASSPETPAAGISAAAVREKSPVRRRKPVYPVVKGLTDRVAAFLIILLLSPALFLVAAAIRLDSPGHPVFTQIRVGKNGRLFNAYKFRTMQANNDDSEYKSYLRRYILHNAPYKVQPDGEKIFKVVEDRRVTRVGGFLRRFNLDELPQLVNIFLGQMSFIGPRPDIPYCVEMYSEWQRQRLSATPGITGLWQVGHRKGVSFDEMVKIDLDYIARISPILDFKITVLTIRTILLGDGS